MKRLMMLFAILLMTGMLALTACEPVDEEEFEQMEQDMDQQQDSGGGLGGDDGGGGGDDW